MKLGDRVRIKNPDYFNEEGVVLDFIKNFLKVTLIKVKLKDGGIAVFQPHELEVIQ